MIEKLKKPRFTRSQCEEGLKTAKQAFEENLRGVQEKQAKSSPLKRAVQIWEDRLNAVRGLDFEKEAVEEASKDEIRAEMERCKTLLSVVMGMSKSPYGSDDRYFEIINALEEIIAELLSMLCEEGDPATPVEIGAVEGLFVCIKYKSSECYFVIDEVTKKPVYCEPKQDQHHSASEAFNRRVSITGQVEFDSEGHPVRVREGEIYIFPKDKDLPTYRDIQRILAKAF